MTHKILILGGDGIGPETIAEAEKVLGALVSRFGLEVAVDRGLVGGAAVDAVGVPLPQETLDKALASDGILFGAIGGPKWEGIDRALRPERGLLALRSRLGLFANLRPVAAHVALADASTLKPEVIAGLDIMIVRELTGGIYFGEPRGFVTGADGVRTAFNTLRYSAVEIERIARVAFEVAAKRRRQVCSVDKANVLEVSELWREVVETVARDYPAIMLRHMYVDNAAMQLVRNPKQFDVLVTDNMFGDILSDLASMLGGSIGMLPSASLDAQGRGMYEPIHGSAPDIAGRDLANPLAAILSLAMLLRYSLREQGLADRVERAVDAVLESGLRTADIAGSGTRRVGTREMGDAVVRELLAQSGP